MAGWDRNHLDTSPIRGHWAVRVYYAVSGNYYVRTAHLVEPEMPEAFPKLTLDDSGALWWLPIVGDSPEQAQPYWESGPSSRSARLLAFFFPSRVARQRCNGKETGVNQRVYQRDLQLGRFLGQGDKLASSSGRSSNNPPERQIPGFVHKPIHSFTNLRRVPMPDIQHRHDVND